MKEPEFIELLNLYLDHEISSEDAVRLEAEVQKNPERRRTYQDYCRMQTACRLVARDFQAEAASMPVPLALPVSPARRSGAHWGQFATFGGLAAAAGLAIIFVTTRSSPAGTDSGPLVQATAASPAVAPAPSAPAMAPGMIHAVRVPSVPVAGPSNSLLLTGRVQSDAMLAAAVEQADARFEWMRMVQLEPIQSRPAQSGLRFESPRPASAEAGARTYGSAQPLTGDAEWVGFRFNK